MFLAENRSTKHQDARQAATQSPKARIHEKTTGTPVPRTVLNRGTTTDRNLFFHVPESGTSVPVTPVTVATR